ncbi:hypothetical protein GCM10023322_64960 [Rugosimonospora acidiphila]|uniref:DUF2147 domain-containing protein n=2 Tax=Rugosimonospora acidiphila TaxID=556531 RepID=A0ABP9SH96_9ACTN
MIGVIALIVIFTNTARAVFDPWSVTLLGHRALIGYWAGDAAFAPGDVRHVSLHLHYRGGDCEDCSKIEGDAHLCGTAYDMPYRLDGDTKDYHGTRFTLSALVGRHEPGVHLDTLDGEWHGDVLRVRPSLWRIDPDEGAHSDDQPADPPPFDLRRVAKSDFRTTC